MSIDGGRSPSAGWFVALVVVLALLLVGLVFTIDIFFPTPDPVEYARAHTPADVQQGIAGEQGVDVGGS